MGEIADSADDIHVVATVGGDVRRLANDNLLGGGLTWTADGKEIPAKHI